MHTSASKTTKYCILTATQKFLGPGFRIRYAPKNFLVADIIFNTKLLEAFGGAFVKTHIPIQLNQKKEFMDDY